MATINGNDYPNNLTGSSSADTIGGYGGKDTLSGLGGDDLLDGGLGNDILIGGYGIDTLIGGRGADTLTGGPGLDFFQYAAFNDSRAGTGYGIDLIEDFSAAQGDVVDLTALGTAILQRSYQASFTGLQAVFKYNATTNVTTLSYYQGSSTAVFQLKFTGDVTYSEQFFGILPTPVTIYGTPGDDFLSAGPGDTLHARPGDDFIFADSSAHVFGGAGSDWIEVEPSSVNGLIGQFDGRDGHDVLVLNYGEGNVINANAGTYVDDNDNLLLTFTNIEQFNGGFSTFIGSGVAETVVSWDWADWAITVFGKGGNDSIYTGEGNDRIKGGSGNDTIVANGGEDTAVYTGNHTDYIITFDDSYFTDPYFATATVQQIGGGGDGTDTLTNVEFLKFADGTYEFATNTFTPKATSLSADKVSNDAASPPDPSSFSEHRGYGLTGGHIGESFTLHVPTADLFF
jgi:Ca2+-binding RTX toxin-like protein